MQSGREYTRARGRFAWIFVALFASLVVLFALSVILRMTSPEAFPPFYYFGWWWVFPLFFFGLFFAFRLWGWGCWWGYGRYYEDSAFETLRQRFARGEITKEQYEQMRKDLEA